LDVEKRDRKDAKSPTRHESRKEKQRVSRSRSGSRDQPRTRAAPRESSRPEKMETGGSSRHRPSPERKRSVSQSSSDSEVIYGKVQSKVDVKRSEVREGDERGKLVHKRSPSPVDSSSRKGRSYDPVDPKSSSRHKAEVTKNTSGMRKISASYSSDSSVSPTRERNGRRMQSAVIEKPTPAATTERRKVITSQKPIELAPAKSPLRSSKQDQPSDRDRSVSSKTRSPERNQEKKTTLDRKKQASRETKSDAKSRSQADRQKSPERSKKENVLDSSRSRRQATSSPKQPKKAERDVSSNSSSSSSSPARPKPQVKPSDDKKKTLLSAKQYSSSSSDESDRESPDRSHKKSPQLRSTDDKKSNKLRKESKEPSDGKQRYGKKDRDFEERGDISQKKTKDKKAPSPKQEGSSRQKVWERSPENLSAGKSQVQERASPGNFREPDVSRSRDDRRDKESSSRAGDKSAKVEQTKDKRSHSSSSSSSSSSTSSSEDEAVKPMEGTSGRSTAAGKPSVVEMRQQRPLVEETDSESSKSRSHSPAPPPRSAS